LDEECVKEEEALRQLEEAGEENERQVETADKALEELMKSVEPSMSFARIIARFVK
jgi:hypothetical protein